MNSVQILDCTLRDGGRIIDCKFSDITINNIARDLTASGIDIIEVGFLRSHDLVDYKGDSTFFTEVPQIKNFLPIHNSEHTMYVAFIDFNMYDFDRLEKCEGDSITGIRVGFTKKQFDTQLEEIKKALIKVKKQGYKLFVQGVNSLAYTDKELLNLIDMINEIEPYSYGIVDTYGAMYLDDMTHYYNVVDYNLNKEICIDVHSHNNFQSSFAFSQEIIRLAEGRRKVILDATLNGMGKCAGNLNTELIADYLNRKKNYDYNLDKILDTIDRYLEPLKQKYDWGYSIPAFMAGIYKSHPNNIIYLTSKYRLNSKDIKYIISGIDESTRQRYDYDNIQRIYREYNENRYDDIESIKKLKKELEGKEVLVIAPGRTVTTHKNDILNFIRHKNPIVISVNFIPGEIGCRYHFYANPIHWGKICKNVEREKCILVSNLHDHIRDTMLVDYSSLTVEDSILYDNSTIMLLNLLKKVNVSKISLAGFDGLVGEHNNYVDCSFPNTNGRLSVEETNNEVKKLYAMFKRKVQGKIQVEIITPSLYEGGLS